MPHAAPSLLPSESMLVLKALMPGGDVVAPALISRGPDGTLTVMPFQRETPSTIYLPIAVRILSEKDFVILSDSYTTV